MAISAENRLKFSGRFGDHAIVMFGSGAGPKFLRVWRIRNVVLVTRVLPSMPCPPKDRLPTCRDHRQKFVVFGRSKMSNNAKFNHEIINNFCTSVSVMVLLFKSVRHKYRKIHQCVQSSWLLHLVLYGSEITKIGPLYGFRKFLQDGKYQTIVTCHLFHFCRAWICSTSSFLFGGLTLHSFRK